MKALLYHQYGGPDFLAVKDIARPVLSKSHAIVRIHAISLNQRDSSLRNNEFKLFTGSKFLKLTGAEFSDVIEAIGENPVDLRPGDAVFDYIQELGIAASAELASIPIKYLVKKPEAISHEQSATLGCTYLTALQALRNKVRLQPKERIIIYGAAGGVGTAAIQLARYFGAYVIAVSKSDNRDYCLKKGADEFSAYDKEDVFSSANKVDVFFQG